MDEENVVPIEKGKRGRRRKGDGGGNGEAAFKPPKPAELYFAVIQAFNRTPLNTLPEPRCRLAVTEPKPGSRVVVRITPDDVCEVVNLEYVVNEIIWYTQHELISNPFFLFDPSQAEKCAKMWRASSVPIEEPKAVRFLTEKGFCYRRLPFDLVPDEFRNMTPLWDEFFSRMTNAQAVKAWIGSLLVPESYNQQYLFLFGVGGEGKGVLQTFLKQVLGDAARGFQGAPGKDNHWADAYVGKRLGMYTDFEDTNEMNKGVIKALTGDDEIYINPKYERAYSQKLNIKLMFSSNKMPTLSNSRSDQRRIIFAEMTAPPPAPETRFHEKLWAEAASFLWDCKTTYARLCPNHEAIPVSNESKEAIEGWAAGLEEEITVFIEENLELDPDSFLMPRDLLARIKFTWPSGSKMHVALKSHLMTRFNIRSKMNRTPDGPRYCYKGIRLKNP